METQFTTVLLSEIQESASNPRQHFEEKGLAELTDSIKTKGIVAPLLLRRVNSHFEIVDGARRYRAAKAAGLEDVPAIVRQLSDDEALELQIITNLQRQDVHPLDEAEGYKAMLATKRYDVAALAAKVGKSTGYVYQRLALNSLVAEVKKAFWEEKLSLGHASLLARIPAEDQKKISKAMLGRDGGAWSVHRLRQEIEEEVMCILDAVGFDKKDPLLVTKAGACTVCPKRSGFNKELFNDITTKDRCMDPGCFAAKIEAHLARIRAQAKANRTALVSITLDSWTRTKGVTKAASKTWADAGGWRAAKKGCPKPETGLVVEGEGAGRVLQVCLNTTCKVCNPKGRESGSFGGSSSQKAVSPAARYKRRMEIWENKVQQVAREEARKKLLPLISSKICRNELIIILREIYERNHGGEVTIAKAVGVSLPKKQYMRSHSIDEWVKATAKASDAQLTQLIFGMLLEREMVHDPSAGTPKMDCLEMLVESYATRAISLKMITADARNALEKLKPKPPKSEPKKKPTKKGSKP